MSSWKRDFASGLVVLAPLLIILFVLNWLYSQVADLPLVETLPQPWGVAIALVVFVMLVFSVGYLMRTAIGRLLEGLLDGLMNKLPGLRVVYNASKLAVETALTGTEDLQKPVKLETWEGLRMTAFKTGKTTDDGREVLFLPTSPNITTGFVVEVAPEDFEETDERVEEALTRVLSAGFGEEEPSGVPVEVREEAPGRGERAHDRGD
ncbi:MAG: DUF502 domain-containing protein [Halobacteriaceae archaeon]